MVATRSARNWVWAIVAILVIVTIAAVLALRSEPSKSASSGTIAVREPAAGPVRAALPAAAPATPTAPAAAAPPSRRVPPVLPRASTPWPFPTTLDRTSLSAERQDRLTELEAQNPNMPGYLDYTLGLVARLHECMPDATTEQGAVEVTFHFALDPETGVATGTILELRDSTISEHSDRQFTECADHAHRGHTLKLSRYGSRNQFYWGTRLQFPLEDNVAPWFNN